MVEMVPATARPPVEKMVPSSGVSSVVPQVGQPAPRAIRPVMMPALSRFSVFSFCFLFQRRVMRPMRVPWRILMAKIGSQSRNPKLKPKIPRKLSPRILRLLGNPRANIKSNLEVPPASRFIRSPKKRKLGAKPHQKRFSLVLIKMPLPAKVNSSSHFLQFIIHIL